MADSVPIDIVSLGMLIIDEIEFTNKPTVHDILGGAGTYSAIGARLLSPGPLSRSVGWIADAGNDFPQNLRQTIDSWQTGCLWRQTPERKTTRGWNGYGVNEHRAFRYTTPKLRLDHTSLSDDLLLSKSFHLICSPERCVDLVGNILARRSRVAGIEEIERPLFVWEPVPDLCVSEELDACRRALNYIDVVSPNHVELCGFFGVEPHGLDGEIASATVEKCCRELLSNTKVKAIVVRSGKDGCYVATETHSAWLPAYHQDASKVVDPTGGGNTFLGGFSITLARSSTLDFSSIKKAVISGAVAASFAIEQIGMPILDGEGDRETWNVLDCVWVFMADEGRSPGQGQKNLSMEIVVVYKNGFTDLTTSTNSAGMHEDPRD